MDGVQDTRAGDCARIKTHRLRYIGRPTIFWRDRDQAIFVQKTPTDADCLDARLMNRS